MSLKHKHLQDYLDQMEIESEVDKIKFGWESVIETLNNYVKDQKFNFELEKNIGGETYYIIHPVLKHIAILGD